MIAAATKWMFSHEKNGNQAGRNWMVLSLTSNTIPSLKARGAIGSSIWIPWSSLGMNWREWHLHATFWLLGYWLRDFFFVSLDFGPLKRQWHGWNIRFEAAIGSAYTRAGKSFRETADLLVPGGNRLEAEVFHWLRLHEKQE
jgi:hypothetical protein